MITFSSSPSEKVFIPLLIRTTSFRIERNTVRISGWGRDLLREVLSSSRRLTDPGMPMGRPP
jgi:hypothetical protein